MKDLEEKVAKWVLGKIGGVEGYAGGYATLYVGTTVTQATQAGRQRTIYWQPATKQEDGSEILDEDHLEEVACKVAIAVANLINEGHVWVYLFRTAETKRFAREQFRADADTIQEARAEQRGDTPKRGQNDLSGNAQAAMVGLVGQFGEQNMQFADKLMAENKYLQATLLDTHINLAKAAAYQEMHERIADAENWRGVLEAMAPTFAGIAPGFSAAAESIGNAIAFVIKSTAQTGQQPQDSNNMPEITIENEEQAFALLQEVKAKLVAFEKWASTNAVTVLRSDRILSTLWEFIGFAANLAKEMKDNGLTPPEPKPAGGEA